MGDFEGSHDFHWRGQRSNLSSLTEYTSKGGIIENWLPSGGGGGGSFI